MSHSYVKNILHVIFSTKERQKTISQDFRARFWAYIAGICHNHGIIAIEIGGIDDHVHMLVEIPATLSLSQAMAPIKANSSRWTNEEGINFAWQEGYAAFSVSELDEPAVRRHIQSQEVHHKKVASEAEFIELLNWHHVKFDPKYVLG
ncbi:MAG TPA: IS200/IS605 family transposase [Candidatus Acidoferrales bacterium]|nr:IS200/IS605 family transposase [Candidatus Acidoferrales bacterium]